MIRVCDENGDLELKAFLVLAPTTGMRKGEILSPQVERHRHRFGESLHIRPADEE